MPDEYLPPNKLLFVQSLPENTTRDEVEALFAAVAAVQDVRTVPGNTRIAFVEFANIQAASLARDRLNGHAMQPSGDKIKITFAR